MIGLGYVRTLEHKELMAENRKLKALFIHSKDGMSVEEAIEIAKSEASRIGMGERGVLQAADSLYSNRCGGWVIVVQNKW